MKFTEEERKGLEFILNAPLNMSRRINGIEQLISTRLSSETNQDGASAEDVLNGCLKESCEYMTDWEKEICIKAMHQFAKSEVEKAVAEHKQTIQAMAISLKEAEEEYVQLQSETAASGEGKKVTVSDFDELIDRIDDMAQKKASFVTAKFGDNWKEYAHTAGFHSHEDLCHMAWFQGRRAILLEKALKEQISPLPNPPQNEGE